MTEDNGILDFDPAVQALITLLDGVRDDQLALPTPCTEYSVGDLLDHLMGLVGAFTHVARKQPHPGSDAVPEPSAANLDPEWRSKLPGHLTELSAAWKEPGALEGEARAGGVTMPAAMMGVVALNEVVIHSWDLARATGQPFESDPGSVQAILGLLTQSVGENGSGLFGPVVRVPDDASPLDQAVGLTGRDPAWTPR